MLVRRKSQHLRQVLDLGRETRLLAPVSHRIVRLDRPDWVSLRRKRLGAKMLKTLTNHRAVVALAINR